MWPQRPVSGVSALRTKPRPSPRVPRTGARCAHCLWTKPRDGLGHGESAAQGHRGAGGAEGGGGGGPSPGAWWWRPRLRGSGRQGPQVSLTRASEVRKACDDFCCKVLTPRPTSWLLGQPLPPEAKTSQLPFASPGRLQPSPQPPRVTGGRGRACLSVRCEWWESSPPAVSVETRRNRVCLGALLKCAPQASLFLFCVQPSGHSSPHPSCSRQLLVIQYDVFLQSSSYPFSLFAKFYPSSMYTLSFTSSFDYKESTFYLT